MVTSELSSIREKIKQLETVARQLEPDAQQRTALWHNVHNYAEQFLENLPDAPAYEPSDDEGRGLLDAPLMEEGVGIDAALALIKQHVDGPGVNPASGHFMGYIPGGGLFPSALGDFLAAVTNRYSGVFYASPGAARMENMLLRWMIDLVGYPSQSAGNLTSGGSIANLTSIVTARDAHGLSGAAAEKAVVYLTEHAHHSVDKALRIAGLSCAVQRRIPVDAGYRMDVAALEAAVQNDKDAGLYPWLVVAAAGTTNTGSVDPLPAIADIAAANGLWFHVDGAYGGFFVLCDEGQRILQGMERSDSLVMDPHKSLFLPYGTGAVLIRDRQKLYAAHHSHADYMQDTLAAIEEISPADLSPELTKHFRGLRLWLPLKLFGVAPFRAALDEKLRLARYFYHRLSTIEGFELGPYPDLSVVIYRYVPPHGDVNLFNEQLCRAMQKDGRVFLSSTLIDGQFVMRLAVLSFRTHLDEIERTIDILQEKVAELLETF